MIFLLVQRKNPRAGQKSGVERWAARDLCDLEDETLYQLSYTPSETTREKYRGGAGFIKRKGRSGRGESFYLFRSGINDDTIKPADTAGIGVGEREHVVGAP